MKPTKILMDIATVFDLPSCSTKFHNDSPQMTKKYLEFRCGLETTAILETLLSWISGDSNNNILFISYRLL